MEFEAVSLFDEQPEPAQPIRTDVSDRPRIVEALKSVEANADESWKDAAWQAIKAFRAGHEFVSEDVRQQLDEAGITVHDRRTLGPVLVRAAKDGLIARSQTLHRDRYGSLKQRWIRTAA